MFLIQYGAGLFVNAEHVCWIDAGDKGDIRFGLVGDIGCALKVQDDFCDMFFNHIQLLNGNIENIESHYQKLNT